MQRVKPRARLLSEEDSFIEDVVEESPEHPLLHGREEPQQSSVTEIFRSRDSNHDMVTIINENVRESRLDRDDVRVSPEVNTADHPISLVYSNNKDPYLEDITTPPPVPQVEVEKETPEVVEMEPIREDAENVYSQNEVRQVWKTPDSEVAESSLCEADDELQEPQAIERRGSGTPLFVESVTPQNGEPQEEPQEEPQKEPQGEELQGEEMQGEEPVVSVPEDDTVYEEQKEDVVYHSDSDDEAVHTEADPQQEFHDSALYTDPEKLEIQAENESEEQYTDLHQHDQSYQPVPLESEDSLEQPSTSQPQIDDYGNELDEKGHPIIKHAFPANWILQPDEGDGVMRFETEDGPVRFIMNLDEGGFKYPNPPNEWKLEMDTYLKHIPTTHRIASGCEFFVDTGEWRLQLDSDVVNVLLRQDIAQDFEDVTGEVLWSANKDITIDNITRAMTIFKDCILDDSPVRWVLAKDSVYNPKDARFRLELDTEIENVINNVSIHDGMDLVTTSTKVSIPTQSDTEVRNVRNFLLSDDSVLEEQGIRHLDSQGCKIEETSNTFTLAEDATLEDQGTRLLLCDDSTLEDQGSRHLICEEGETVDITREHRLMDDAIIEDIKRGFLLSEDSDRLDIKRHYLTMDQDIERTPALWDKSHFEGDLVDLKENRMEMDIKYNVSPSKFTLNQLDIDDDMLAEIEEVDD